MVELSEDAPSVGVGTPGEPLKGDTGSDPAKPDRDPDCVFDPRWVDIEVPVQGLSKGRAGLPTPSGVLV